MSKTRKELVQEWLKSYPADANDIDLEFNAVAGYVERRDGTFQLYADWQAEREYRKQIAASVAPHYFIIDRITDLPGIGETCVEYRAAGVSYKAFFCRGLMTALMEISGL